MPPPLFLPSPLGFSPLGPSFLLIAPFYFPPGPAAAANRLWKPPIFGNFRGGKISPGPLGPKTPGPFPSPGSSPFLKTWAGHFSVAVSSPPNPLPLFPINFSFFRQFTPKFSQIFLLNPVGPRGVHKRQEKRFPSVNSGVKNLGEKGASPHKKKRGGGKKGDLGARGSLQKPGGAERSPPFWAGKPQKGELKRGVPFLGTRFRA